MNHSYLPLVNNQPEPLYGRLLEGWRPNPVPLSNRPRIHLMAVAGVRGAGKTTFMKALAAGRIDPKVLPKVPQKPGLWEELEPRNYSEWMPRIAVADGSKKKRLALHCDLVGYFAGLHAPTLDLFGLARKVTLVAIKPDFATLTAQFSTRECNEVISMLGAENLSSAFWSASKQKANGTSLTAINPGERAERIAVYRREVLQFYNNPGWVDRLYAEWEELVLRLAQGVPVRILEVAPAGQFDWVLVRDSIRQDTPAGHWRTAIGI